MGEILEQTRRTQTSRISPGLRFLITAAIFSITLFGVLRIPFVERYLLLPFTQAQHGLACRIGGDPEAPITVGLSCSAADVIALCLGFVMAFPVAWRKRLFGAALGLVVIAAVNTVRIATLSHAVRSSRWFDLLHLYIWPGVLLVVVSIYVFLWMNRALRGEASLAVKSGPTSTRPKWSRPTVRFVLLTLLFVALFVGTSSWWMESPTVLTVANWVAATGALCIRLFGGEATVTGNVLRTANGSFLVTQECIMTPLIPAYFAAVLTLPMKSSRRNAYLIAAFPIFFILGAARLLILAFPTRVIGSHLMAIHGFFQILLAVILVILAVTVSSAHSRTLQSMARPAALALLGGILTAVILGLTYNRALFEVVAWLRAALGHSGHLYFDPQGALLLMAPYQMGLFVAFWLAWSPRASGRRLVAGMAGLALSQIVALLVAGEWAAHTSLTPHVAAIRAWSVISTVLFGIWLLTDLGTPVTRVASHATQTQNE